MSSEICCDCGESIQFDTVIDRLESHTCNTILQARKQALKNLKDDFKAQIEYIENIEIKLLSDFDESDIFEENLDYLVRDNSEIKDRYSQEPRLKEIRVLNEWLEELGELEN